MKVRHLLPALVLTLALALAGQPAPAQSSRHGGGPRGSHRVAAVTRHPAGGARSGPAGGTHVRSGPAYAPRGGVAERRHPRAGTGRGGYGYSYRPRHGGYYRPYYGRSHRPYHGGYYRPYYGGYYRPYFYGSLSVGWPYYSTWPYASGGYDPGYSLGYDEPYSYPGGYDDERSPALAREATRSDDRDSGRLRLEVRPDDTSVYVDDEFRGAAREARFLILPPGRHTMELVRPGFVTERRDLEVAAGESRDVLVEMQRPR